ncbi:MULTISPECIES: FAD binding domain-containing protein [Streptomyces]|uniref:Xanthine dehydrogenase family protein subunit M n=1 Tax=Streptomyces dengpaensis TaxID=2049881 RepID=A0ABM6T057_9ACTN|nr:MULTISPECIES: xanthine dehydrogenase family protein subunit M [Streptomyces]AVH60374.1 xanthine dehydrogenase family protein subunit M [Streptomyces dengpaensis]PIB06618.1 FAD-binding molybdopterin dehydrogenase [Streptomyces sp. HG99]
MHPFTLERPDDAVSATRIGSAPAAEYIAGGTDMMQLLTDEIRCPEYLVSLDGVLDDRIEVLSDGSLRLGAAAKMSDIAADPDVSAAFPVIAEALLLSASGQVRNMATIGGNLLQRTRCPYFRDPGVQACNKRSPGSGCAAMNGVNRTSAVLGVSKHCIATNASDVAVALVALGAEVHLVGPGGERIIRLDDLYRAPGDTPHIETVLDSGELITAVVVPPTPTARRSYYLKVRDRVSFEFALTSAAVALEIQDGSIREARVAMGGVGTKPWRLRSVENALNGRANGIDTYLNAAEYATEGAVTRAGNQFKPELMKRTVVRALSAAGGRA